MDGSDLDRPKFLSATNPWRRDLDLHNSGEYINLTRDGGYVILTDNDTAGTMGSGNFGLMKLAPQ